MTKMSLVSRRIYLITVLYIYQEVDLDVTKFSHMHLLQRLIKPGSQIVKKILRLIIRGTSQEYDSQLLHLCTLFSRLIHLRQLDWRDSLDIPCMIMEALATHSPNVTLLMDAFQTRLRLWEVLGPSRFCHILLHPTCKQLRTFNFEALQTKCLYDEFKRDLIYVLQHIPQLESVSAPKPDAKVGTKR
jgi:hypothetical protein